ncbi:hypothetical protein TNCV_1009521 [Trichonephila clavipes]|nr:hypothetical protein TNCV_1009521 [Trichonephila clavipes]
MQGLLVMDLVILNHGQVIRTTPELAHSSPNFHTTPTRGRLSLDIFNVHQAPLHGRSSAILGSSSRHGDDESITLTTMLPRPHNAVVSEVKSLLDAIQEMPFILFNIMVCNIVQN